MSVPDFIFLSDFLSLCVCTQSPVIQKCVENIYSPTTALILPGSSFYMPGWSVSPPHITNRLQPQASKSAGLPHSFLTKFADFTENTCQARTFALGFRPIPLLLAAKLQVFTDTPTLACDNLAGMEER